MPHSETTFHCYREDPALVLCQLYNKLLQDELVTAKGVQTRTCVQVHFSPESQSQSAFNAESFLARLTTEKLGCTLLTAAELPSTQTLLHDNAGRIPNGTVCVADRQVMGKGGYLVTHSISRCAVLMSKSLAISPKDL